MSVIDLFQVSFRAQHPLAKLTAVAPVAADGAYGATQIPLDANSLNGVGAIGVVQRDVNSGQSAPVMLHGITRAIAGAAITAPARVTATASGYLVTATSGGAARVDILGDALTSAASGMIFHLHINRRVVTASGAAV
jgi:hypothetical protein